MARDAVNRVLTEIAEGRLAAVPQAEELRLQVAKNAADFNERFLRQRPKDPSVLREAAMTYRKVANIQRLLGLTKDAGQTYERAIALTDTLLGDFAGNVNDQLNFALTLADVGELERTEGDLVKAEQTLRRALEVADPLVEQMPGDPNAHLARGTALLYLAQVQNDARRAEHAAGTAQRAATEFRGMLQHPLTGARNALLLFLALDSWGKALRESGHPKEAEKKLVESATLSSSLLDFLAKNPLPGQSNTAVLRLNIQYARAQAELELGLLLASDPKRRTEATVHFDRATTELSALAEAFPRVSIYQKMLGVATRGWNESKNSSR
jgi:tetratricopeptide (TPR) repeat protein